MSFSLTDAEIKRMLWYDYLFAEKMVVFFGIILTFVLTAIVLWSVLPLIGAIAFAGICLTLSRFVLKNTGGYIQNHQGQLQLLMCDDLMVVRLHYTDLELKYDSMKPLKPILGLWRLKCSDFYTFILPKRIVKENSSFFQALYAKIK